MFFKSKPTPRKTIFFHIMKTGGSTFRDILSSIYGDSLVFCDDPALDAIKANLSRFNCLEFHNITNTGWNCVHSELVRLRRWDLLQGCHSFTMLRDPVDQLLSQYFFNQSIRSRVEPMLHAAGGEFTDTLEEYLDYPAAYNEQLAFLVGKTQGPGSCVDDRDLADAKDMLLQLQMHVGLTERFADSMNVFETVTGHRIPDGQIKNRNRNSARPTLAEVPNKLKERIRKNSQLDIELYRFGTELLLKDLARCGKTREYSFLAAPPAKSPQSQASAATPDPPVKRAVFIHVMRTGGKTFRSYLASIYGDQYHVCDDPSLDSVQANLRRYHCNIFQTQRNGAASIQTHSELIAQSRWDLLEGSDVFTLLRDPVDHVISMYHFLCQGRPSIDALFHANGIKFPETIEAYLDEDWHRNGQLASLMGKRAEYFVNTVTRDDLAAAKDMLTRVGCHIGLTERFNDSLNIFETVTGRQSPREHLLKYRENPNRPRLETIPSKLKDRILEENALDVELYEFARTVFEHDLQQCKPTRDYSILSQGKHDSIGTKAHRCHNRYVPSEDQSPR